MNTKNVMPTKFGDVCQFEENHPMAYLNEKPLPDAIEEIKHVFLFTRIFATQVRLRLEPILSIDFAKVDKSKLVEILSGVVKTMIADKLTPEIFKKSTEGNPMLQTIDKKFAEANMPLNLYGISQISDEDRSFMLEFIRYWGEYENLIPTEQNLITQ